ncbi:hypothetical protein KI387_025558, partial [Taxus chinensis]
APSIAPPFAPPTNILDNATQPEDANTDDFENTDDEVDTIKLTDEALGQLNFTPVDVDDFYFEDTFVADGS